MTRTVDRIPEKRHKSLTLSLILLSAFPRILRAQDAGTTSEKQAPAEAKESEDTSKKPERIEVIGSRIKRSEVETSSPVKVIERKEIEASGAANLGEILRGDVTTTFGNFAGNSGYVRAGSQTASLYGLGAGRTLVLLDGERLPKDASLSGTNLNLIPKSAIERIEILSGGRSAVYGSDAVAGVINVITRKDFRGNFIETAVRAPEDGGGNNLGVNVASGFNLGPANVVLAGGYEREQRIYRRNRDFPYGEGKFTQSQAAMPAGTYNYRIVPATGPAQLWQPSPNCPAGSSSDLRGPGQIDRGVFCVGDSKANAADELTPSQEGGYFSTRVSSDVGSESTLNAFATYSQRLSRGNSGNYFAGLNYLNSRRQMLTADQVNDLGLGFVAPAGTQVEFYKLEEYAPDRINYNKDQSYGGFLKFETALGNWNSDVSFTHYTSEAHRDVDNVIDKVPYSAAFFGLRQDPATLALLPAQTPSYVLVDPNRNPAALADVVSRMSSAEKNAITAVGANVGRDLLDLPGGRLAMNIGLDSRVETFDQIPDPLDVEFFQNQPRFTGTEAVRGRGDRAVTSGYAEFLAPVTKDLNVDAAVRYDDYSDFGSSTNYNYGIKYNVTSSFALRHAGGTSYHAPELNYIHQVGGGGYNNIRDERWCAYRESIGSPCIANEAHQIFVDRPGNDDLKPEKARSYSIGFLFEPSENFYLSADYLAFHLEQVFAVRPIQDIVDDYYGQGEGALGANKVTTDPNFGYITTIARPYENISQLNQYLVQISAGVNGKAGPVKLGYKTDSTRTISRKTQEADGTMKQQAGYEGIPAWRWNNAVTFGLNKTELTLSSNTISKQAPDPENNEDYDPVYFNDQVDEFTMYDASLSHEYSKNGHIVLGVSNLANKIGGLYRTGNFTGAPSNDPTLYSSSWNGRSYYATLGQKF